MSKGSTYKINHADSGSSVACIENIVTEKVNGGAYFGRIDEKRYGIFSSHGRLVTSTYEIVMRIFRVVNEDPIVFSIHL